MNEKLKKETPIPSRLRGRGVEVSKTLFYIFKSVTRCKYLDMLIEGRIGTRAGSEHYGQHDKKIV